MKDDQIKEILQNYFMQFLRSDTPCSFRNATQLQTILRRIRTAKQLQRRSRVGNKFHTIEDVSNRRAPYFFA